MKCNACGRELKNPNPEQLGPVCAKKNRLRETAKEPEKLRVELLSSPRRTDARVYLVFSDPFRRVTIRLPESGTAGERFASCECGTKEICEHISRAIERDVELFPESMESKDAGNH